MRKKIKNSFPGLDELDAEFADLRILFLEILKNYQARVEEDINSARTLLSELKKKGDLGKGLSAELKSIHVLINSLETKAERGRRKDLKKIEDTMCEALNVLESWK